MTTDSRGNVHKISGVDGAGRFDSKPRSVSGVDLGERIIRVPWPFDHRDGCRYWVDVNETETGADVSITRSGGASNRAHHLQFESVEAAESFANSGEQTIIDAVAQAEATNRLTAAHVALREQTCEAMRTHFVALAHRVGATDETLAESDRIIVESPTAFDASTKVTLMREGQGLPQHVGWLEELSSGDRAAFRLYADERTTSPGFGLSVDRYEVALAGT